MTKTLGILGGGQLGMMSAQAAQKRGIKTHILTPEHDSPASQIADHTTIANYDDQSALKAFAESVDVITYEFENIPLETVQCLKTIKPVYPDEKLLEISQDRITEKTFLNNIGIPTTRWEKITGPEDIETTLKKWSANELILKTIRFGYDGKGQIKCSKDNIETFWKTLNAETLIAEEIVQFQHELSIIIARDSNANTEIYGPVLNIHKNHILDRSVSPAPTPSDTAVLARNIIHELAQAIDLIGVMTLELFLTADGRLLANEIAPRTHNSGHWTIEACETSQFENHVRAVCGLSLGSSRQHAAAEMINLIGHDIDDLSDYENKPGTFIHLYGKKETREGRKMGHVTILKDKLD